MILVSQKKFATAINCMDGRTQLPVIAYLKEKCKVDYVDMVTEAGPVKILANCEEEALVDSIKNRVGISVGKHRSKFIAVAGHSDCAGNPVSKEVQMWQILKSIKTVKSWNFKANVLGLWIDENWAVHEVKEERPA